MPNPDYVDGNNEDRTSGCIIAIFMLISILYYGYHLVTKTPIVNPCPYRDSSGELRDDC